MTTENLDDDIISAELIPDETPTLIIPKKDSKPLVRAFFKKAELLKLFTCESKQGIFKRVNEHQAINELGEAVTFNRQEIITYVEND